MRNSICLIVGLALILFCSAHMPAATIEALFSQAMTQRGEAYLDTRVRLLTLAREDDSYLTARLSSADSQTRLLAEAFLERIHSPELCRYYEESMIVPIQFAIKCHAGMQIGPRLFENIVHFTREQRHLLMPGVSSRQPQSVERLHNEAAFAFLAEMALKDTMSDLPKLSGDIEWSPEKQHYTIQETAVMLGVLPQTAEKWLSAGLFHPHSSASYPMSVSQPNLRTFYSFYSDKIINPEYLRSREPVSRVVHSDISDHTRIFQEEPGSLFRCYAVLMLASFSRPEVADVLYSVYLKDSSDYVRAYCVEGFSAQTQVYQLRKAMQDASWRVRQAAAVKSRENLDAFEVSDYLRLLSSDPYLPSQNRVEILHIIAEKGDKAAVKPLIEMLGTFQTYGEIVKALKAIDSDSIYQAIEHPDSKIRKGAWGDLIYDKARFNFDRDYLIRYFRRFENDSDLISSSLYALSKTDPGMLLHFFNHKIPWIRALAIQRIADTSKEELHEAKLLLVDHLKDPVPEVRRATLYALRHFNNENEIAVLFLKALNDPDAACRHAALEHGGLDIETLDALLRRESEDSVRWAAIDAVIKSPDPSAKDVLIRHSSDEYSKIRWRIAEALGKFNDEQTVKALKELVHDDDYDVSSQAISSLIEIDIHSAPEILAAVRPELRRAVYYSLGKQKSEGSVGFLIPGTRDEDADVRKSALLGLQEWRYSYDTDHPAVAAVRKGLEDDNAEVRAIAVSTLSRMIGHQSLETIARCLYDSNRDVKAMTIQVLASSKSPDAVGYLLDAMEQEEDRQVLVRMVNALREITGNLLTKEEWMQWRKDNVAFLEEF